MADAATDRHGILPDHAIEALAEAGAIRSAQPFDADQVQPASLDLRLGAVAYRLRASFLPGPAHRVADKLEHLALHELALEGGAVLETGCVYLVPLAESLALPADIEAAANPKSSTGRLDIFTRLICDRAAGFDSVPAGYAGPLWLEISPTSFPVLVRPGSRLAQIRFRRGQARLGPDELAREQQRHALIAAAGQEPGGTSLAMTIDLADGTDGIVGWCARRHTGLVDVDKRAGADRLEFWEPVPVRPSRDLVLDPHRFYILVSREAVHVPPHLAAEMLPFDATVGEFRAHYAGFFDPGFGHAAAGGAGARAVLEVRSLAVPFVVEHGQRVGRLAFEKMAGTPRRLYGTGPSSNYQAQKLKLSKHFR